tara:strand:- start:27822 stop:28151 length:330 start_codon:yes stop_codon:yes gene_type:complete
VNRKEEIEQLLKKNFACTYLEVVNESHQHSVPANSETHFKVTIVSSDFSGKTKVARHQAIYALTNELMEKGLHALALHIYLPEEWQALNASSPESPNCMGGSKKARSYL